MMSKLTQKKLNLKNFHCLFKILFQPSKDFFYFKPEDYTNKFISDDSWLK